MRGWSRRAPAMPTGRRLTAGRRLGTGGRLPCGRRRCPASELGLATVLGAQAQHESRAAALPDRGGPVAEAERGGGLLQGLGLDFDALEGEQLYRGQLSEAGLRGGAPVDEEGEAVVPGQRRLRELPLQVGAAGVRREGSCTAPGGTPLARVRAAT